MQKLNLKIKGLYIDPNSFSEVPLGALVRADNISIDKDSVAESRRGFNYFGDELTDGVDPVEIKKAFNYKDRLITHYNSKLAYDSTGSGDWVNYSGTYNDPAAGFKMRSVLANRNFYFNTAEGIQKLDALTATPVDAGAPKALNGTAVTTGGSGFMSNNTQIAYRIVWGFKDLNNNLILGAPSQRIIVVNASGGTRDVTVTFQVPTTITTNWLYQIYRSAESASSTDVPNDEMQLVYEDNPDSGEIAALSISVTDSTPDDLKGAALYTNPTQGGIIEANDQPPFAKDIASYKGFTLFANTRSKQRLNLTLISVGGSAGIASADTVTIAGQTYTGGASENIATKTFKVTTSGTPAENIALTAQSLIAVINGNTANTTVYAYYLSGYEELPGRMLIEERDVGGAVFYATSSKGSAFNPTLSSSGTANGSDNDEAPNRIYYSKNLQPEAVPLLQYLEAGSKDYPIKRIVALRDSVFILKDDGIYRLFGENPQSFNIVLLDNTARILAPESAVSFNNQVFMFSDQGVVSVSDAGVSVLSKQIESELLRIATYTDFGEKTFGVAYESERKYILFTFTDNEDTYPTQAFVFNSFTNAWTKWIISSVTGVVESSGNKLYLAQAGTLSSWWFQERKNYDRFDYSDESFSVNIVSSNNSLLTVTLTSATGVEVGMALAQGIITANILAVNGNVLTVDVLQSWNAGAALVYRAIDNVIQWAPIAADNVGVVKHFREASFFFRDATFREMTATFRSNFSSTSDSVALSPVPRGAWGVFPWGLEPWGGGFGGAQAIRTYFPLDKQRAIWIDLTLESAVAFTSVSLLGISLMYEEMSGRFR